MERLTPSDVLAVIRRRITFLERENNDLRAEVERLTARCHYLYNDRKMVRRSRTQWREKAKERRREREALCFSLVDSHPKSKAYLARKAA